MLLLWLIGWLATLPKRTNVARAPRSVYFAPLRHLFLICFMGVRGLWGSFHANWCLRLVEIVINNSLYLVFGFLGRRFDHSGLSPASVNNGLNHLYLLQMLLTSRALRDNLPVIT